MNMKCTCVESYDKQLETDGLRVEQTAKTVYDAASGAVNIVFYPTIRTERIVGKKGKTPTIEPNFCPFCGVKYEKKDKT